MYQYVDILGLIIRICKNLRCRISHSALEANYRPDFQNWEKLDAGTAILVFWVGEFEFIRILTAELVVVPWGREATIYQMFKI